MSLRVSSVEPHLKDMAREFERAFGPEAVRPFSKALDQAGAPVTWLRRGRGPCWQLLVQTPADLRDRFALAPELHLVVTDRLQVRDLDAAWALKPELGGRVDLDLVVVCSLDARLQADVADVALEPGRQVAAWPLRPGGAMDPLVEALTRSLPVHDPFNVLNPVRGGAVRGRGEDIAGLVRAAQSGETTAVLGLRKVGKTTLVRAVTDLLRGDPGLAVAWADGERARGEVDRVARAWVKDLGGRESTPPLDALEAALDHANDQGRRLCLVLDEFDVVLERPGSGRDILALLGLLRGFSQGTRRLALVLVGRDPTLLTGARLHGKPNPFLAWATHRWVGPLTRADADSLLVQLGRRCALEVGPRSLTRAFDWTGGHPLLLRQFGSCLLQAARAAPGPGGRLLSDPVLDAAERHFLSRQHVRAVMTEILSLLGDRYPGARDLLAELVQDLGGGSDHPHRAGTDWEVLANFGLLGPTPERPQPSRLLVEAVRRDVLPLRQVG